MYVVMDVRFKRRGRLLIFLFYFSPLLAFGGGGWRVGEERPPIPLLDCAVKKWRNAWNSSQFSFSLSLLSFPCYSRPLSYFVYIHTDLIRMVQMHFLQIIISMCWHVFKDAYTSANCMFWHIVSCSITRRKY